MTTGDRIAVVVAYVVSVIALLVAAGSIISHMVR